MEARSPRGCPARWGSGQWAPPPECCQLSPVSLHLGGQGPCTQPCSVDSSFLRSLPCSLGPAWGPREHPSPRPEPWSRWFAVSSVSPPKGALWEGGALLNCAFLPSTQLSTLSRRESSTRCFSPKSTAPPSSGSTGDYASLSLVALATFQALANGTGAEGTCHFCVETFRD
ncbi:hypothetical protein HJG60_010070 [Phyllostomus discolor]|uniref:Uncharacterized protein n=1 Tax=Phyllostomus discolor TaxID=89673 RepID=A0A834AW33_9CHIR|nr:hypothetical protein HJG60_010070 [Phyllostomus discolor]